MVRAALQVDTREKVAALRRDVRPGLRRRYRSIELTLAELSKKENAALTEKLNRLYQACGCLEGAIFGALGLLGYGVWMLARSAGPGWGDLLLGGIVFFLATTVGKLAGLLRAHVRLNAEVDRLAERLDLEAKREPPKGEGAVCAVN